jgi:hypothetical protein
VNFVFGSVLKITEVGSAILVATFVHCASWLDHGLPDFSWYNMPKRKKIYQITMKYTKWSQNIPNGRKIDQMSITYSNIFHCKTIQNFTQIWFENMPSGNPASWANFHKLIWSLCFAPMYDKCAGDLFFP